MNDPQLIHCFETLHIGISLYLVNHMKELLNAQVLPRYDTGAYPTKHKKWRSWVVACHVI